MMTDMDERAETCPHCGKPYETPACSPEHDRAQDKIRRSRYADKSWPPKSMETK